MIPHGGHVCHFPSSAVTITWQQSAVLTHCDRATLCLHTEFNHSSPHLCHGDGNEDGGEETVYEGEGWKEVWKQSGAEAKYCQLVDGVLEQGQGMTEAVGMRQINEVIDCSIC